MTDLLADPAAWLALLTLTSLEIVLGIDNIIMLSIVVERLEPAQRSRAMRIGLLLAMAMRILLLLSIAWIIRLTAPLFSVLGNEISGRDLILIGGGLFLLAKSTHEIHRQTEGEADVKTTITQHATMAGVLVQIVVLDAVFSLDSVITAIGMSKHIEIMIAAVVIAVLAMMIFAGPVARFVERHPTIRMLALSFLLLVGMALIADGLDQHMPKGYIYFAMGFSVLVEALNLRAKRKRRDS